VGQGKPLRGEEGKALYREALSRWASGVTVVAVRHGEGVKALTASAFASLSLDPPLVLVCLSLDSRTLPILKEAGRFTVSILAEGQEEVSAHFAGSTSPRLERNPPFAPEGDPVVEGSLAALACRVWAIYPGGDHEIVVGEVERVHLGGEGRPLLYWRRAYRHLAQPGGWAP
jgi:flavin reductase (NADH)